MSRWFRFYEDAINDPKVQRLEPKLFKAWVNVLCLASQNDGWLPDIADAAFIMRTTETEAGRLVDALVSSGLLDEYDGRYTPHNWNGRQFKSDDSNERVKRHRQRKCNVAEAVTVTPPDTDTDTDTEQSKKEEAREGALSSDDPRFPIFWDEWPNKVGKPAALKAFKSAVKRSPFGEIMDGLRSYIRDKPPDRPWLNPATFLNQNRWEDRPAAVGASNGTSQYRSGGSLIAALDRQIAAAELEEESDPALSTGVVLSLPNRSIR